MSSGDNHGRTFHYGSGYSVHVCVLRPHSRGQIRLHSADMRDDPLIELNLLQDERDMATMLKGVKLVHQILEQPVLTRFGGKPLFHGHLKFDGSDDEAVKQMIREHCDNVYHPVGSCRMGGDEQSVVDPQLRVRGVQGLRVADASVIPLQVGGNTNAPTIMVGEKCADLLLAERNDAQPGRAASLGELQTS
ncbi:GMC family oxidoreductase [Pseudomonas denitrificans (nom. rej.)]|uniref:GMC family oxidoreductase n=2 Tax=Pseudomonadaceae TaxID=135621 RepID=UPI001C3F8052|nr:GMC oxidoreductase [Pseudomonas denitrificans (nom. rej.)]